ncbi:ActS/PrrB/RegB family redox-sensitive histidine kinase [Microbaculum marinisediminis]|uniref:histidine kinase n=1 Tax=Microbaculum marinisediminis TaxID=2931392 RepID=A0AAW5R0C3_9HYPH|nr:ActS/PrrB/RegB family redox-sensitive histidine kinase [Microbaculum sp. A6E488]MCT8971975.1 ActS/PrrB/RegB family redox-sensitive histidine kinase [Microbaculum sp. A6E488]
MDDITFGATRLRLHTLTRLRWIAVAGQSVAVLGVYILFGYDLPLGFCFALIAFSAWLNIFLRIRYPASRELTARLATVLLGYDIVQLAVLLALTGGLANPFSILLLVPVVVSASALPPANTVLLGGIALTAASIIGAVHLPLPWLGGDAPDLPVLYISGIWVALALAIGFTGVYAFRVAREARQMSDALAAAALVLAREQHLSALDGLAAAAAHELGTPLATIALVSRELERDLPREGPHAEDVRLLRSQVERCRGILERIGSLGEEPGGHLDRLPLSSLIEEIAAPHREFGIDIRIHLDGAPPEPVGRRDPGILYGLGNLAENAVDFAASTVDIRAGWTADTVTIEIVDDGPGFTPEVLAKIGEPYISTRGRRRGGVEESGLGLGLFIAKTLLERSGAQLLFANRAPMGRGAFVSASWPRSRFEVAGPAGSVGSAGAAGFDLGVAGDNKVTGNPAATAAKETMASRT